MPNFSFVTLDVFTTTRFGGNPLVVFPDAAGMDTTTMQALAREFNLSESAFVLPPEDPCNTARVRIFTSDIELGFAGHPNVGVAWLLSEAGKDRDGLLRLEQASGIVEIVASRKSGKITSCRVAAPMPLSFGQAPSRADLAACAGLCVDDVADVFMASVALTTACVSVTPSGLARAKCDVASFHQLAAKHPDLSKICLLFLYVRDGATVRARMFAPLSGTIEDPATGSAASALTAALLSREGGEHLALEFVQGVEMGRPSRMQCEARRHENAIRAWVSGSCVPVLRGVAEV